MRTRVLHYPWNGVAHRFVLEHQDKDNGKWHCFATMSDREDAIAAAKAYLDAPVVVAEFTSDPAIPSAAPGAGR